MPREEQLTPYNASDIPPEQNILVLAPHPDDEIFGCGGAIALHLQRKCNVQVVLVTSGDIGGEPDVRIKESINASKVLGSYVIETWNYHDRGLCFTKELIEKIIKIIHKNNITLVYAPSLWENHPDHRAVALSAIEALRQIKTCSLMQYEVSAPLRPNMLIDITPVLDIKIAAMECFASQLKNQKYNRHILGLNQYRSFTLNENVKAAEAYEYYDSKELELGMVSFFESEYRRQQKIGITDISKEFPLVSILIRSMDKPNLKKTLLSAAMQTYFNIEIIVVNASGKKHQSLDKEINAAPIYFIDSLTQLSRSQAANLALKNMNGKYALFLDDDDWIDALHVEKLVNILENDDFSILSYTDTSVVDENKKEILRFNHNYPKEQIYIANFMPIHSVLFRAYAYTEHKCRFDENIDIYEDWDFWIQLSEYGNFTHTVGVSAYYLVAHGGSSDVHNQHLNKIKKYEIFKKWQYLWKTENILFLAAEAEKSTYLISQNKILQNENLLLKNDLKNIFNSRAWKALVRYRRLKAVLSNWRFTYNRMRDLFSTINTNNGSIRYSNKFISNDGKKLVLFSHYDQDNLVDKYVIYYLQSLLSLECDIVFISTAKLPQEEVEKVEKICSQVIVKENIGYDFGAWKTAIEHSAFDISKYEKLILCNDSVYAPLYDMKFMFDNMEQKKFDMWSITESRDIAHHLQSYFMVFNANIISSNKLFEFLKNYKVYRNKRNIVEKYEVGLTLFMKENGHTVGAYCQLSTQVSDIINITHSYWDSLIVEQNCPIIKIELLRDNPTNVDLSDVEFIITKKTSYPFELIKNHLQRVSKRDGFGLLRYIS